MWIFGIMFAVGLCLAGSKGEWSPWVNMLGVVMIGIAGIVARMDEESGSKSK